MYWLAGGRDHYKTPEDLFQKDQWVLCRTAIWICRTFCWIYHGMRACNTTKCRLPASIPTDSLVFGHGRCWHTPCILSHSVHWGGKHTCLIKDEQGIELFFPAHWTNGLRSGSIKGTKQRKSTATAAIFHHAVSREFSCSTNMYWMKSWTTMTKICFISVYVINSVSDAQTQNANTHGSKNMVALKCLQTQTHTT